MALLMTSNKMKAGRKGLVAIINVQPPVVTMWQEHTLIFRFLLYVPMCGVGNVWCGKYGGCGMYCKLRSHASVHKRIEEKLYPHQVNMY